VTKNAQYSLMNETSDYLIWSPFSHPPPSPPITYSYCFLKTRRTLWRRYALPSKATT